MDITTDTSQVAELAELWKRAPDIARAELLRTATEIDLLVQGELMQSLPKGAGGLHGAGLVGSVFTRETALADRVIGMVATSQAYADDVEVGTRKHMPPIQPLVDWVEAKLGLHDDEAEGAAWAIAKTIAKRGTRPQPVWQETYKRILPTIQNKLQAALGRIRRRLEAEGTA